MAHARSDMIHEKVQVILDGIVWELYIEQPSRGIHVGNFARYPAIVVKVDAYFATYENARVNSSVKVRILYTLTYFRFLQAVGHSTR